MPSKPSPTSTPKDASFLEGITFNALTLSISAAALIVAAVGAYFAWRAILPARRRLTVSMTEPTPLLSRDADIHGLEISYNQKPIKDAYIATINLINSGKYDIASSHFDQGKPLVLELDTDVLRVISIRSRPDNGSSVQYIDTTKSSVIILPQLIPRKKRITIELLTHGRPGLRHEPTLIDTEVDIRETGDLIDDGSLWTTLGMSASTTLIAALLSAILSVISNFVGQ